MAYLVKLKHQPQKWLLRDKLAFFPVNNVIKRSFVDTTNKQLDSVGDSSLLAKNMIRDFVGKKNQYYQYGYERSVRNYQSRLVIETLIWAINLVLDTQKESDAIFSVSTKVAQNIAGNLSDFSGELYLKNDIKKGLDSLLSINLFFPVSVVDIIKEKYSFLSIIFNCDDLYRCHESSVGARLGIRVLDASFYLGFDDKDADKILSSVHNAVTL
jgi:hypothetical protein